MSRYGPSPKRYRLLLYIFSKKMALNEPYLRGKDHNWGEIITLYPIYIIPDWTLFHE